MAGRGVVREGTGEDTQVGPSLPPSLLLRWIKDALLETDRDGDRGERARVGGIQRGPRRRGKERPYSRATHKRTSSQRDGHSLSVKGPVSLLLWTNSR